MAIIEKDLSWADMAINGKSVSRQSFLIGWGGSQINRWPGRSFVRAGHV